MALRGAFLGSERHDMSGPECEIRLPRPTTHAAGPEYSLVWNDTESCTEHGEGRRGTGYSK